MTAMEDVKNPLVRKLGSIASLTEEEKDAIRRLPMTVRDIPPRTDIVREGDRPTECCLLIAGFTIRYKLAPEGRRQIIAVNVPGDMPDLQSLHLAVLDHTLASLTKVRAGFISHKALHELNRRFPPLAGALWRATLVDAAIFRDWIVNLGQRDAISRTAHFLCEMQARLGAIGLTEGKSMQLPFTQADLADALGISPVHMNRTLQELRARDVITLKGGQVEAEDWNALKELGAFDPTYLHFTPHDRPKTN